MSEATTTMGWVPQDDFAARLLLARKQAGLTVREAAVRCGVHYATWSTWERGSTPANMAEAVDQISRGIGCDRAWLAWGGQLAPAVPGSRRSTPCVVKSAQTRNRGPLITERHPVRREPTRRRSGRTAPPLPEPIICQDGRTAA